MDQYFLPFYQCGCISCRVTRSFYVKPDALIDVDPLDPFNPPPKMDSSQITFVLSLEPPPLGITQKGGYDYWMSFRREADFHVTYIVRFEVIHLDMHQWSMRSTTRHNQLLRSDLQVL